MGGPAWRACECVCVCVCVVHAKVRVCGLPRNAEHCGASKMRASTCLSRD